jgi:hypothetical protein
MIRTLLLVFALLATSAQASSTDYTDIWYNPSESGWGVNMAQNGSFIFATFFVYSTNNSPTWYTGQLSLNASDGSFSGPLYATTGPYYGGTTFDPTLVTTTPVGSATFRPAGVFGVITYNVGGVIVSKNIQRQTLTTVPLVGQYRGGQTGSVASCTDTTQNTTFGNYIDLTVTQASSTEARFSFQVEGGAACTIEGSIERFGMLSRITDGDYNCTTGLSSTATLYEVKVTSQGIEGSLAGAIGGNCLQTIHFSTVSK